MRYQLEVEITTKEGSGSRPANRADIAQMVGGVCDDVMDSLLKGMSSVRANTGVHDKLISVYGVVVPTVVEMIADQSSR